MEVFISPEFGSPTLIFKLWESLPAIKPCFFAPEESENGCRSLKIKVGEPDMVPVTILAAGEPKAQEW